MRFRTAAALPLVLVLACELVPTDSGDAAGTTIVLDLRTGLDALGSQGRVDGPVASSATLHWKAGSQTGTVNTAVVNGIATFQAVTVPKGGVAFWAGAETASGVVILWSLPQVFSVDDGFEETFGLEPISPDPRMTILEPAEKLPDGADTDVQTVNAGQRSFDIEIRNARAPDPVVVAAESLGHPTELTWTIVSDPDVTVSEATGLLGPGEADTVTVSTPRMESDIDVDFHFVNREDSYPRRLVKLRVAAVQLVKTTYPLVLDTLGDTLSHRPPGPIYRVGDSVEWRYFIRNNSAEIELTNLVLTDSLAHRSPPEPAFPIPCLRLEEGLAPGDTVTCVTSDTVKAGTYQNVARVTALTAFETLVAAADTNWHQGSRGGPGDPGTDPPSTNPGIELEVYVDNSDADSPPGLGVVDGQVLDWQFIVRNVGKWPLSDVVVTEVSLSPHASAPRHVCGPFSLSVGSWHPCSEKRPAIDRPFASHATATATGREPESGLTRAVSDSDETHYSVASPTDTARIDIEKTTNGAQADTGPGPTVTTGDPILWRYVVRNTGTADLTQIAVTDSDPSLTLTCIPSLLPPPVLSPGDSIVCSAAGVATLGQYGNEAVATGTAPDGALAMDSDSSHYEGEDPPAVPGVIELQKSTNGHDADVGPGPSIPLSGLVEWHYVVKNTGTVDLTQIAVTDSDPGVTPTCVPSLSLVPAPVLSPGDSIICRALGSVIEGPYSNVGTATALPVGGGTVVMDTDSSHYVGVGMTGATEPPSQSPALYLGPTDGAAAATGWPRPSERSTDQSSQPAKRSRPLS